MSVGVNDRLLKAVRRHGEFTDEQLCEVAEHGADTGDCCRFFDKYAELIWGLLVDEADR